MADGEDVAVSVQDEIGAQAFSQVPQHILATLACHAFSCRLVEEHDLGTPVIVRRAAEIKQVFHNLRADAALLHSNQGVAGEAQRGLRVFRLRDRTSLDVEWLMA